MGAAREHGLLTALEAAAVRVIADSAYRGAAANVEVPQRRPPRDPETGERHRRLSTNEKPSIPPTPGYAVPVSARTPSSSPGRCSARSAPAHDERPDSSTPSAASSTQTEPQWKTLSDERVRAVDELQATYREGPCVTALWDQHTVSVEDLVAEACRWPRFGPAAAEAGVGSMLSFQLFARENSLGALNLYAGTPHSFTDDSRMLGGLFAMHAATALGQAQHVGQLHEAMRGRDVIGQAKGMLMERFSLDAEQAFAMLVASSQSANMKLLAVARWLTGSNPESSSEHDGPASGKHGA